MHQKHSSMPSIAELQCHEGYTGDRMIPTAYGRAHPGHPRGVSGSTPTPNYSEHTSTTNKNTHELYKQTHFWVALLCILAFGGALVMLLLSNVNFTTKSIAADGLTSAQRANSLTLKHRRLPNVAGDKANNELGAVNNVISPKATEDPHAKGRSTPMRENDIVPGNDAAKVNTDNKLGTVSPKAPEHPRAKGGISKLKGKSTHMSEDNFMQGNDEAKESAGKQECGICCGTKSRQVQLPCGRFLCTGQKSCFKQFCEQAVAAAATAMSISSLKPILCPFRCGITWTRDMFVELEDFMTQKEFERLTHILDGMEGRKLVLFEEETMKKIKQLGSRQCPRPGCKAWWFKDGTTCEKFECKACGHFFCWQCMEQDVTNDHKCKTPKKVSEALFQRMGALEELLHGDSSPSTKDDSWSETKSNTSATAGALNGALGGTAKSPKAGTKEDLAKLD